MSQAPLIHFITGKQKFVIRHVFKDVKNMKDSDKMDGPIKYHYNIPWKIRILRVNDHFSIFLACLFEEDNTCWFVDTEIAGKTIQSLESFEIERIQCLHGKIPMSFPEFDLNWPICSIPLYLSEEVFINDKDIGFELNVTIVEAKKKEFAKKLINFGDEAAKEVSDVTLIVEDQKFHVCKMYLAHHSTYFKSLFFGNFAESQISEIELKGIVPTHFQDYLELIYAETFIEEHSVHGILHVADFSDSKTVVRRCQEFLIQKSELPLHKKFEAAVKYNLEELKTKCISEINSVTDLESIVPENSGDFNTDVWKELFKKSISMIPK